MRLIEHKTALYGIQIFLRTNIDTDNGHTVTLRPDAEASVVKYRNASEFEATRFRVKRGMTINRRFLKKLNEYKALG